MRLLDMGWSVGYVDDAGDHRWRKRKMASGMKSNNPPLGLRPRGLSKGKVCYETSKTSDGRKPRADCIGNQRAIA